MGANNPKCVYHDIPTFKRSLVGGCNIWSRGSNLKYIYHLPQWSLWKGDSWSKLWCCHFHVAQQGYFHRVHRCIHRHPVSFQVFSGVCCVQCCRVNHVRGYKCSFLHTKNQVWPLSHQFPQWQGYDVKGANFFKVRRDIVSLVVPLRCVLVLGVGALKVHVQHSILSTEASKYPLLLLGDKVS